MEARPDLARDFYQWLQKMYINKGNKQLADMVFYSKVLQFTLKKNHDKSPGRFSKNDISRYMNLIQSYQVGEGDGDPGILANIGEVMFKENCNDYAIKCFNDCIDLAARKNSSQDIRTAYLRRLEIAIQYENDSLFNQYYSDARRYANHINNNVFNEAVLENFIGETWFFYGYNNKNYLEKAQNHYDKAKSYIASANIDEDSQLAQSVSLNIALNQLYMGNDNVYDVLDKIERNNKLDAKDKDYYLLSGYEWLGRYYLEKKHFVDAVNILGNARNYIHKDNFAAKRMILLMLYQAQSSLSKGEKSQELEKLIEDIKKLDNILFGGLSDEVRNLLEN